MTAARDSDSGQPDSAGDSPTARKIYSVPRRYDLATLFVVSLAYAGLFGLMRALGWPPLAFALVAGFITVVGLGQALLFGGNAPREASVVCGVAFFFVPLAVVVALAVGFQGNPLSVVLLSALLFGAILAALPGVVLGYLTGVLIGGLFLVADLVRGATAKRNRGRTAMTNDE